MKSCVSEGWVSDATVVIIPLEFARLWEIWQLTEISRMSFEVGGAIVYWGQSSLVAKHVGLNSGRRQVWWLAVGCREEKGGVMDREFLMVLGRRMKKSSVQLVRESRKRKVCERER
ncbi:unnamed protein product [Cuscuta epithymum]|uniref:Uncharacterized protein n=1 Tax=Cuscuta epithymum TaxID=186058 RepID=A0AAV0EBR3_9ASTE|nr:unnamed protein product [Cuscuta epithymum]